MLYGWLTQWLSIFVKSCSIHNFALDAYVWYMISPRLQPHQSLGCSWFWFILFNLLFLQSVCMITTCLPSAIRSPIRSPIFNEKFTIKDTRECFHHCFFYFHLFTQLFNFARFLKLRLKRGDIFSISSTRVFNVLLLVVLRFLLHLISPLNFLNYFCVTQTRMFQHF